MNAELQKIQSVLPNNVTLENFHPMDFYSNMMLIGNWECKAVAEKLDLPYKNKRIFTKLLIEKIEKLYEQN